MSMPIFEGVSKASPPRAAKAASAGSEVPAFAAMAALAVTVILLAACNSSNDVPETTADADGKLFCAVDGAAEMTQSCLLERMDSPEGQVLVVHHPQGGFRRFEIVRDGRGVVPADGAEPSKLFIVADNMIDVTVGGDRYRFPATIGPKAD